MVRCSNGGLGFAFSPTCQILLLSLVLLAPPICAVEFDEPFLIYQGGEEIQFSYNTSGAMAVDSKGRIHLVYFIADAGGSLPDNRILYQTIADGSVSSPARVDSGDQGGGRHPTLAVDSQDAVHIAWQDYRHTTAPGNYIDNLEIYYDKKTPGGSFSIDDVRITNTSAGHMGDSGYVPNIDIGADDRIEIAWYDFTANGNNADVYLRRSTGQGAFPLQEGIESFRITDALSDPTNYTANWMPDVAALADGSSYVIWGFLEGWQGSFQLQGRSILSDGGLGPVEKIADQGGRFLDPPRLASDRDGNLGLASSEFVDGFYQVNFYYKPKASDWIGPIRANDGSLSSSQPSLAFDSSGIAHVVWQEDLSGMYQAMLASIDPQTFAVNDRRILSSEDRDARTPAIAVDPRTDQIYVVWIEFGWDGDRSIVGRSEAATGVTDWKMYVSNK
ncbi:MAG: hypothetical protein JXR73_09350 [Candidatus Omnitrophica bacterium]|nr:hypothetical protein [Candidatus Omnitrophota bacterium]